jgi:hypothetical protein
VARIPKTQINSSCKEKEGGKMSNMDTNVTVKTAEKL